MQSPGLSPFFGMQGSPAGLEQRKAQLIQKLAQGGSFGMGAVRGIPPHNFSAALGLPQQLPAQGSSNIMSTGGGLSPLPHPFGQMQPPLNRGY